MILLVTEVFLDGFDVVPGLDGNNSVGVSEVVKAGFLTRLMSATVN